MSALSSIGGLSASSTGLPVIDPSTEPAAIRNGDQTAKNAYQTGMGFEQMLDNQLTQTLSATISGTGSSDDGLGQSTGDGSQDPAAGAFSSMMPDALTSGLLTSGGTGIAMQIARGLDPALEDPAAPAAPVTPGASGSGVTTPSGGVGLTTAPTASTASTATAGLTTASEVGI
jgi:Rod binding domain-containing protein